MDSHARALSALDGKRASRYQLEDGVPYLIALGNHDLVCSPEEIMRALYGPDQRATRDLAELATWERAYVREAFFGYDLRDGSHLNTRVAAVALFRLVPWSDELATFHFLEHPSPYSGWSRNCSHPGSGLARRWTVGPGLRQRDARGRSGQQLSDPADHHAAMCRALPHVAR